MILSRIRISNLTLALMVTLVVKEDAANAKYGETEMSRIATPALETVIDLPAVH